MRCWRTCGRQISQSATGKQVVGSRLLRNWRDLKEIFENRSKRHRMYRYFLLWSRKRLWCIHKITLQACVYNVVARRSEEQAIVLNSMNGCWRNLYYTRGRGRAIHKLLGNVIAWGMSLALAPCSTLILYAKEDCCGDIKLEVPSLCIYHVTINSQIEDRHPISLPTKGP